MLRRFRYRRNSADAHNHTFGIINKRNLLRIRNYQRRTWLNVFIKGFEDSSLVRGILNPVRKKRQIGLSGRIIINRKPAYQIINIIIIRLVKHGPSKRSCRKGERRVHQFCLVKMTMRFLVARFVRVDRHSYIAVR